MSDDLMRAFALEVSKRRNKQDGAADVSEETGIRPLVNTQGKPYRITKLRSAARRQQQELSLGGKKSVLGGASRSRQADSKKVGL